MTRPTTKSSAVSILALSLAAPVWAQDTVQVPRDWDYAPLYAEGWSVETMFDVTEVVDITGEEIGDVENVIFSNDGQLLGIVAEVGGFWDIGDTHVFVPWDQVTPLAGISRVQVPVTEETVDDYDVFGTWGDEQIITAADTDTTQAVDDDLLAGAQIFKATDLIGDYAYLPDGVRYGYVSDIIVRDDVIGALVTDAGAYGQGYYAHPYAYGGGIISPRYDLPYNPDEVGTIESFDYDKLQSQSGIRQ